MTLAHLRMTVPADLVDRTRAVLDDDPRVVHLVHLRGASVSPAGDAVEADVSREAAGEVIEKLKECGLAERGGITLTEVEAPLSEDAERAEAAAAGDPDDSVVWPVVIEQAEAETRGSFAYFAFLTIACALAAIAVITDSTVLVVGAMVVSPDFAVVSAIAVGCTTRRPMIAARALRLLVVSFAVSIGLVTGLALVARATGLLTMAQLLEPRPMTGFIWQPDVWSLMVALLAGTAGTLSMTSGKSNALVGVFISVTTVPAAGNLALALALWVPPEVTGSLLQLGINLTGMIVSGIITLVALRLVWDRIGSRHR